MRNAILAVLLAPVLLACGDDVVNYSAPVGINFQAIKSADAGAGNAVVVEKNVNTESGNPYGAFVNGAERALGRVPSRIVVTYLGLELLPSTVATLDLAFTGPVAIGFKLRGVDPVGTVYPVGTFNNPVGTGVPMAVTFDSAGLPAADYAELLGGGFDVVFAGTLTSSFATGNETAALKATFGLMAYK